MPFELKKYIDSLELSDEERKVAEAIFAKEKNVAEMNRGYAARDEASRLMDEGTKARQLAATERADADRIKAEAAAELEKNRDWANALKKYEPDFIQTTAERDALAQEKAQYEAYLESIGVEPSFALSGKQPIKPPTPPVKDPPPVNQPPASATITPEELKRLGLVTAQQMQPAINLLSDIPFQLTALNFKHMELYGKAIPATELNALKDEYLNPQNTRSLTDIAAEKLHFADREKELSEQAINERVKREAEEMYTKRMSELNLPGAGVGMIQPNMDSVVKFASKGFSENAKRAGDGDTTQVSAEEMQQFLQVDQELAAAGIRPGGY